MVRVVVEDAGIGIPEEEMGRIFDRFHQTETSERRKQGGVGIGLALAHELAELHGGSLTVESRVGAGSTFTLFLPHGKEHFDPERIERRQLQTDLHPGRRTEDRQTELPPSGLEAATMEMRQSHAPSKPVLLDRGRRPRVLIAEDEDDLV